MLLFNDLIIIKNRKSIKIEEGKKYQIPVPLQNYYLNRAAFFSHAVNSTRTQTQTYKGTGYTVHNFYRGSVVQPTIRKYIYITNKKSTVRAYRRILHCIAATLCCALLSRAHTIDKEKGYNSLLYFFFFVTLLL